MRFVAVAICVNNQGRLGLSQNPPRFDALRVYQSFWDEFDPNGSFA
jgi:hypothetical protein